MPLYIAVIDLTKAFDLVSRDGLFKVLPKIGCSAKRQSMIESFHIDTKGTVQFNGSFSEPFEIRSGVKQGCVLAPTLSDIFFGLLLKHAFDTTTEGIYLRTRSDGRLFNLARLRANTKLREVLIRDMLFADDAAVVAHTQEELQSLMDCFSHACKDFGLTISLKKTNVLGQDTEAPPVITIDDYELDAVCQFTYLGSTITDNLSLDAEINKRIGKAASTLARLTARVWTRSKLSIKTKMSVYNACSIIAVWQRDVDYVFRAGEKAQHIIYGELALGRRTTGRPHLRYKDVCVRYMKAVDIDTMSWEGLAADRTKCKSALKQHLKTGEDKLMAATADNRARRKEGSNAIRPETTHICDVCNKDCHSQIGLFSHKRRCYNPARN